MEEHLERRHVLALNITERRGHGLIGTYRALPESIVDVAPLDVCGARVAIALPGRDPLVLEVRESPEAVITAIARARELDGVYEEAGTTSR
ncbi:MAG: hypothetical protein ACYTAS_01770 [Planctomycetota bacterium]|jgi:hypothetical protein